MLCPVDQLDHACLLVFIFWSIRAGCSSWCGPPAVSSNWSQVYDINHSTVAPSV